MFSKSIKHCFNKGNTVHEVERNNDLIKHFTDDTFTRPKLYPSFLDIETVKKYTGQPFVTMTPSSVWFTKKYPAEKWVDLINCINLSHNIYLLGGKENIAESEDIQKAATNKNVINLAGKLSFLQSAALMRSAKMNYVNDSAPLHFASAVNANVTAIFCSTIPAFGYTPLSDKSIIVETEVELNCRPCSVHGRKACPLGHFKCAHTIKTEQLLKTLAI